MASIISLSGRRLSINGTTQVPPGLFGVHNMPHDSTTAREWGIESVRLIHPDIPASPATAGDREVLPSGTSHIVDCLFDRYRPALPLTEGKAWKEPFLEACTQLAEACREAKRQVHLEFWNEPYLNWACNPGTNQDPQWYEQDGIEEGSPCTIKGRNVAEPHLEWRMGDWFIAHGAQGLIPSYVAIGNNQGRFRQLKPGESYEYRGMRIEKIRRLVPVDVHQAARTSGEWYSGPQNASHYLEMFKAFSQTVKSIHPPTRVIAGWGFHAHQDGWQPWPDLFKPIIDQCIDQLDGIHEHHYGEDPIIVSADYETINAYAITEHGKPLSFYNTEAGPNYDPQQPNPYASQSRFVFEKEVESAKLRGDLVALSYFCRDILNMIRTCPDKAVSRAEHHPQHSEGTALGFKVLRSLRGELLELEGVDDDVIAVASINGRLLTVAFFLMAEASREIQFQWPESLGDLSFTRLGIAIQADEEKLVLQEAPHVQGSPLRLDRHLPTLLVTAIEPSSLKGQTRVTQHHARGILDSVSADSPLIKHISLSSESLESATSLRLKFVQNDLHRCTGPTLSFNGETHTIPTQPWTTWVSIDRRHLQTENEIHFQCESGHYEIWMTSLECISTSP